ncbi:MAG: protein kinase [Kouleothrix sp.]|nr:protein kinase [Kouleothrix sp.]
MTDHLVNINLGQYHLIESVRQGGMATVYKAYQPSLDRFVAVKVLLQRHDTQLVARFRAEARAIALLQHPNILPIYDYGEQDGLFYLVLQYVEGGASLADLVGVPLAPARAIDLTTRLLAALDYAHARGVIHRDIKPANVLLPAPDWPALADFGISKLLDDLNRNLTATGTIIGTAAYMAPEQALGRPVDARTDLYSVGILLYELLTGRLPFEGESPAAVLMQQAYVAPPPPRDLNPALSPEVEAALLRSLAKNPDERFQSARAMAEELSRVAGQPGAAASVDTSIGQLYVAGVQAFEQGRWDQAIAHLNQVVARAPEYEDSTQLLSAARTAQDRAKDDARQQFVQSRPHGALAPESPATPRETQPVDQLRTGAAQTAARATAAAPAQAAATPAAQTTQPPDKRGRAPWQIAALAIVAVLALVGVAALVWPRLSGGAGTGNASTSATAAQPAAGGATAQPSAPAQPSAQAPAVVGGIFAQATGTLAWRDVALRNDGVVVGIRGMPPLGAGEVYAAWLVGEQDSLAIGTLGPVDDGGLALTYTSPAHENLLARYDRVFVTKVPDIAAATEVANVVLAGVLPTAELAHLRHGLFSFETTPNKIGFALGLRQELDELLLHAQLLKAQMEAGRLPGEQLHVEHIVNIIEGRQGQHFGDLNGDGKVQNPGDGFGLLQNGTQQGYINGMVEHALLAASAPDAPPTAKPQADAIRAGGEIVRDRVSQVRDLALAIDQATSAAATRDDVLKLVELAGQAIDGDQGAITGYRQLQAMATIALAPVDANAVVSAPAPAPVPAPNANATNVAVVDNNFAPSKITVVRGTTIVWANQGSASHTVTAEDGSFDSTTLSRGGTFSHTFTEPGIFPYYCQFHGGPHGEAMSGTVIVTDKPAP